MVRRRSTVRFRIGALDSRPILEERLRLLRRGSSVGQSTRLIIVVSRVQVPPPLHRRPKRRGTCPGGPEQNLTTAAPATLHSTANRRRTTKRGTGGDQDR